MREKDNVSFKDYINNVNTANAIVSAIMTIIDYLQNV